MDIGPERGEGANPAKQDPSEGDLAHASLSEREHQLADNEEDLSQREQTLADKEQGQSDRDQAQSDRDQRASDQDQAAADWDSEHGGDPAAHERSTAARAETTAQREEGSFLRDEAARERDSSALERDELAVQRDQIAEDRDREARELDVRDALAERHTLRVQELRARARSSRKRAAWMRVQAARDRQEAARDRERAAYDLEHAGTDELTGARRRGVGLEELGNEMKRAQREGHSLIGAYVDVDELKSVNDELGHAAGDELLQTISAGLREHMRPYDLIVRLGGDEFLCVLPNVTPAEAHYRFDALRAKLKDAVGHSVTVGYTEMQDGDSPDDFIRRADANLIARRRL